MLSERDRITWWDAGILVSIHLEFVSRHRERFKVGTHQNSSNIPSKRASIGFSVAGV